MTDKPRIIGSAVVYKDASGRIVDALIVGVPDSPGVVDLIIVGLNPLRIQIEKDVPHCLENMWPDEGLRCWGHIEEEPPHADA